MNMNNKTADTTRDSFIEFQITERTSEAAPEINLMSAVEERCCTSIVPTTNNIPETNAATAQIIEFSKKMLRKQNLLQGMMSDLLSEIDAIKKQLQKTSVTDMEEATASVFTEFTGLPISNEVDLSNFENYLNDVNMNKTALELSKIGGNTVYELIFRIGSHLISNKFAGKEYSFLGRKNKKCFKDLKLAQLFMKGVQKAFPQASQKEVEVEISKWLKRCSERGRRED